MIMYEINIYHDSLKFITQPYWVVDHDTRYEYMIRQTGSIFKLAFSPDNLFYYPCCIQLKGCIILPCTYSFSINRTYSEYHSGLGNQCTLGLLGIHIPYSNMVLEITCLRNLYPSISQIQINPINTEMYQAISPHTDPL